MVVYTCPRCGYTNNIKTKYINHLNRKKICKPVVTNNNLMEEYMIYGINKNESGPEHNIINVTKKKDKEKSFVCSICQKNI